MVAAQQHRKTGAVSGNAAFTLLTLCEWEPSARSFTRETSLPAT